MRSKSPEYGVQIWWVSHLTGSKNRPEIQNGRQPIWQIPYTLVEIEEEVGLRQGRSVRGSLWSDCWTDWRRGGVVVLSAVEGGIEMSPRDAVYKDWTNDTFSELNRGLLLSNKGLLLR